MGRFCVVSLLLLLLLFGEVALDDVVELDEVNEWCRKLSSTFGWVERASCFEVSFRRSIERERTLFDEIGSDLAWRRSFELDTFVACGVIAELDLPTA